MNHRFLIICCALALGLFACQREVMEEPIIKEPTMMHASPVMSQTIVPEESCSPPPTSFYREEIELEPIVVRDVSPDGVTSSLFRHMSK